MIHIFILYLIYNKYNLMADYSEDFVNNAHNLDEGPECLVDSFGGKGHSYGLCVRPPVANNSSACSASTGWGFDCMTTNFKEMVSYMDCLLVDDKECMASDVTSTKNAECSQISGNTYALKTNSKCIDSANNEHDLYKYINNQSGCKNIITGRSGGDAGAMMKALTKAGCIVDDGLYKSFMGDTKPKCTAVTAKCSLSAPEGGTYKLKKTPKIYLENEQASFLKDAGLAVDAFTNLHDDIFNYYKSNPDIILNKNNFQDNINNINNTNNTNNINDIFNSIILLFLLYIIFKILYKK